MLRKLLSIIALLVFYFWITESKENVQKVHSMYQYVVQKITRIDFEINLPKSFKDKKW